MDQLENDGVIRSRNSRNIEEENKQLVQKLNEMENEIKRRKSRKKEMQRAHQQDLRNRDRREFIMLTVVATCLILYCVVALFIRGFV
jgi:Flp pilus assembly protein TadB